MTKFIIALGAVFFVTVTLTYICGAAFISVIPFILSGCIAAMTGSLLVVLLAFKHLNKILAIGIVGMILSSASILTGALHLQPYALVPYLMVMVGLVTLLLSLTVVIIAPTKSIGEQVRMKNFAGFVAYKIRTKSKKFSES